MDTEKVPPIHFVVEKKYDNLATEAELQRWCIWHIALPIKQHWELELNSKADDTLTYHISKH